MTEATGYIGSSVAIHLIKQGHEVFGLVRDKGKTDDVKALGFDGEVILFHGMQMKHWQN